MLRHIDSLACSLLCSLCLGDGAGQETRSQVGQILWVSYFQVQDAPGYFTRSTIKFALHLELDTNKL